MIEVDFQISDHISCASNQSKPVTVFAIYRVFCSSIGFRVRAEMKKMHCTATTGELNTRTGREIIEAYRSRYSQKPTCERCKCSFSPPQARSGLPAVPSRRSTVVEREAGGNTQ